MPFFRFGRRAREAHDEAHDTSRRGNVDSLHERKHEQRRTWGIFRWRGNVERQQTTSATPSPTKTTSSPSVLATLRRRLSGKRNAARRPSSRTLTTPDAPTIPSPSSTSKSKARSEERKSTEEQAEIQSLQEFANNIREFMGEFRRATAALQEAEARRAAMPPTVRKDNTPLSPIAEDTEDDALDHDEREVSHVLSVSLATPIGFHEANTTVFNRLPHIPEGDEDDKEDIQAIATFVSVEEEGLLETPLGHDHNDEGVYNTGPTFDGTDMDYSPIASDFGPPLTSYTDTETDSDADLPVSFVSADDGVEDGVWSSGSDSSFGVPLEESTLGRGRFKCLSESDLPAAPLPVFSSSREPTPRPPPQPSPSASPNDEPLPAVPFPSYGQPVPRTETSVSGNSSSSRAFFTAPSTMPSSPSSNNAWSDSNAPLLSPFLGARGWPNCDSRRERILSSPGSSSTVFSYIPNIASMTAQDELAIVRAHSHSRTRPSPRSRWSSDSMHDYRNSVTSQIQSQLDDLSTTLRDARLRARSSNNLLNSAPSFLSLSAGSDAAVDGAPARGAVEDGLLESSLDPEIDHEMLRQRNMELERELERVNGELRQLKSKNEVLLRTVDLAWETGRESSEDQIAEINDLKRQVDDLQASLRRLTEVSVIPPQHEDSAVSALDDGTTVTNPPSNGNILPKLSDQSRPLLDVHNARRRVVSDCCVGELWTPPHTPHSSKKPLGHASVDSEGGVHCAGSDVRARMGSWHGQVVRRSQGGADKEMRFSRL